MILFFALCFVGVAIAGFCAFVWLAWEVISRIFLVSMDWWRGLVG